MILKTKNKNFSAKWLKECYNCIFMKTILGESHYKVSHFGTQVSTFELAPVPKEAIWYSFKKIHGKYASWRLPNATSFPCKVKDSEVSFETIINNQS